MAGRLLSDLVKNSSLSCFFLIFGLSRQARGLVERRLSQIRASIGNLLSGIHFLLAEMRDLLAEIGILLSKPVLW